MHQSEVLDPVREGPGERDHSMKNRGKGCLMGVLNFLEPAMTIGLTFQVKDN